MMIDVSLTAVCECRVDQSLICESNIECESKQACPKHLGEFRSWCALDRTTTSIDTSRVAIPIVNTSHEFKRGVVTVSSSSRAEWLATAFLAAA